MQVVELLQQHGKTLAGVITDDDASKRMLDEMVAPLGVEVLSLPVHPPRTHNKTPKVAASCRRSSHDASPEGGGRVLDNAVKTAWKKVEVFPVGCSPRAGDHLT